MTRRAQPVANTPRRSLRLLLLAALVLALALPSAASGKDDDEDEDAKSAEPVDYDTAGVREKAREDWKEHNERWGVWSPIKERLGPYLGAGALGMFPVAQHLHNGVNIDSGAGAGFNIRLGLRAARHFGLEVLYEQVLNFDISNSATREAAKGWFWSLNAKGFLWNDKRLQPYAMVGVGAMSIDPRVIDRRTGFAMRFAGGIDYYVTEHIVWDLEGGYALGTGTQVENYSYGVFTTGLAYKF